MEFSGTSVIITAPAKAQARLCQVDGAARRRGDRFVTHGQRPGDCGRIGGRSVQVDLADPAAWRAAAQAGTAGLPHQQRGINVRNPVRSDR
jgi:hypothetical protein